MKHTLLCPSRQGLTVITLDPIPGRQWRWTRHHFSSQHPPRASQLRSGGLTTLLVQCTEIGHYAGLPENLEDDHRKSGEVRAWSYPLRYGGESEDSLIRERRIREALSLCAARVLEDIHPGEPLRHRASKEAQRLMHLCRHPHLNEYRQLPVSVRELQPSIWEEARVRLRNGRPEEPVLSTEGQAAARL